jgi:hypothetical protein
MHLGRNKDKAYHFLGIYRAVTAKSKSITGIKK